MPDSVKLSSFCFFYSRCFFQADNIVMWSRFFPDGLYIYLNITPQKGILQAVQGRGSVAGGCLCENHLAAEECFFLTLLWCVIAIETKMLTLYHLPFLETNTQHINSSSESEILSEMENKKRDKDGKNPHVWFYIHKFNV